MPHASPKHWCLATSSFSRATGTPITVLIVDDSALMPASLSEIISSAPDLEVVGAAPDPIAAREMINAINPNVLTPDVEMPGMNGPAAENILAVKDYALEIGDKIRAASAAHLPM